MKILAGAPPPNRRKEDGNHRSSASRSNAHGRAEISHRHKKYGEASRNGTRSYYDSKGYSSFSKSQKLRTYNPKHHSESDHRPRAHPTLSKDHSEAHDSQRYRRGSTPRYSSRSPQQRDLRADLSRDRISLSHERVYSSRTRRTEEEGDSGRGRRLELEQLPT